jgi:hypothetical protein
MGEFKINVFRRLLIGIRAIYCLKRNFTVVFESKLYLEQILDLLPVINLNCPFAISSLTAAFIFLSLILEALRSWSIA